MRGTTEVGSQKVFGFGRIAGRSLHLKTTPRPLLCSVLILMCNLSVVGNTYCQQKRVTKDYLGLFSDVSYAGRYVNSHNRYLRSGTSYIIEMESQEFDTYLAIKGSFGQVYKKDNGGSGLNSRIVVRPLRSKIYRIIATSKHPGVKGNYTIRITPVSSSRASVHSVYRPASCSRCCIRK